MQTKVLGGAISSTASISALEPSSLIDTKKDRSLLRFDSRYQNNRSFVRSHFTIVALLLFTAFQSATRTRTVVSAAGFRRYHSHPGLGLSTFVPHSRSCTSTINLRRERNVDFRSIKLSIRHFSSHTITMSSNSNNQDNENGIKKHDVAIYWFRNALRFHDNPSLVDAIQSSKTLVPIYVIDPDAPFAQTSGRRAGAIRANFMLESIQEIQDKLSSAQTSDGGSDMIVLRGAPHKILPQAIRELNATALYYEREPAAPIREMDIKVLDAIDDIPRESNVAIHGYDTHTLHPMEHYLSHTKDQLAPSTYGVFTKIFNKMEVPIEVPTILLDSFPPLPSHMDQLTVGLVKDSDEDKKWKCPTLKELGYDPKDIERRFECGIEFHGGEDAGLKLLKRMMKRTSWVSTFEKPKTSPNALTVDTTGLSACK